MAVASHYQASPIFLELNGDFADEVTPAVFPKHVLRFRNQSWAERLGLGTLTEVEWQEHFAQFHPLPQNLKRPLALRYHGHQFRSYNPHLGDGRGFLFAQLRDPHDGRTLDLGTKGSGQTPYSRGGDGRLTLKGVLREVLATEMLESLGVYTSKSFSVFETGEQLERNDEPSPTRSGVLVRLSHSHIRFGTFQRYAAFEDKERIEKLLNYCVCHYFPHLESVKSEDRVLAFLSEVARRSADLCASWMMAGFVHGVLNTDNMNITGESFDYGPYRFLPTYQPGFTAAYFDQTGLYAYGRQPEAVLWNLERLAECLTLLAPVESLVEVLQVFGPRFNETVIARFIDRMGLESKGHPTDVELFVVCFQLLEKSQVEFEQFFFDWYGGKASMTRALRSPKSAEYTGDLFGLFRARLEEYSPSVQAVRVLQHSYFQRTQPCSLLIDEIENIWDAIDKRDDWSLFEAKVEDIRLMGKVYERREV